jgi:transcriptional regulator with XRE-family HTH domain
MKTKQDKALAIVLKKIRLRAGYTQVEMANKLGISYQQLQKYENGQSRLAYTRVLQYLEVLNIDVSSLQHMLDAEFCNGL